MGRKLGEGAVPFWGKLGPHLTQRRLDRLDGMQVGLGPGHIVLDGDPAPSPRKMGHSCRILVNFYCVQTSGWIKMPLGMEVALGPGRIVLHWDPAPPHKTGTDPQFSAHVYCGQTVAHLSYC